MKTNRLVPYRIYCLFCFICTISELPCLLFAQSAPESSAVSRPIAVGVFDGHGGAQTCIWETVAALQLDPEMCVRTFTASDLANQVLDSLDAIIIPGGSGKSQYLNLGERNRQRIRDFVADGKGAVGICAGAYLFSNTPGYTCMALNGQQAIDIAHDNRGHGLAKFTLHPEGKRIFPELAGRDTSYVIYYEGPVFVANPADTLSSLILATMESDVHEEGNAPANLTNGKPFFVGNSFGKGRVFSSIAHPEATPGMLWMIPRMVRWTLNKPLIPYASAAVQPALFDRELLMTPADLTRESQCFQTLLQGSSPEKIAALDWLEAHHSWDAKRWIQGVLYDASPAVRIRAARYVAHTHYLPFLPDLRAAYRSETDPAAKTVLKKQLDRLEALLPKTESGRSGH